MTSPKDLEIMFQPGVFERVLDITAFSPEADVIQVAPEGVCGLHDYGLIRVAHPQLPGMEFIAVVKQWYSIEKKEDRVDWILIPCMSEGQRIDTPLLGLYEELAKRAEARKKRQRVPGKDWSEELSLLNSLFQDENPNYFPTTLEPLHGEETD